MENTELLQTPETEKNQEMLNTDEFIPDYSFMHKLRQLRLLLDSDAENYGFCIEA